MTLTGAVILAWFIWGMWSDLTDPEEQRRRHRKAARWHRGQNKYPAPAGQVAVECRSESFAYGFMHCRGTHRMKARRYR
jgi:hypothetical protein